MKIKFTLFFLFTLLSFIGFNQEVYYKVTKKLDGAYALTSNGTVNFLYEEEYNDSDGFLTYAVYDNKHQVVLNQVSSAIACAYGSNQLQINTNTSNFTTGSFYILEIINEKNEKWYLRFKVEGSSALITDNLVLHYDFNNPTSYSGTGTAVTDLVSQHNGTTTGSPTFVSRNVGSTTGLTGNCMEFNGTQGINLANSFNHTDWTVSYWFHYRGNNNYYQRFWGMGGFRMELAEVNGYFYLYDGGWVNTGVAVPTTGWKKISFGYKNSPRELTIRINGVTVYTAARGRTMNTTAYIDDSIDNHEAQCYLGEVLVYGKYLSDAEEQYNFNSRKANYGY